MLEPLKQFICDTCGGVIEKPEEGWVEWIQPFNEGQRINKDFRICHHNSRCMTLAKHPDVSDNHLNNMLEDNSMVLQLLDMLSGPNVQDARPEDIKGITEMLRRLVVPFYEEARKYISEADYDGPYTLLPDNLKAIIEEHGEQMDN